MRREEPLDDEFNTRTTLREYLGSIRRAMANRQCYVRPTHSSSPLKQGPMGGISKLKKDLQQDIYTWQREVDLKVIESVWGAHVRTLEEDELSEEYVCEPPLTCLCCTQPPETVECSLLYAYQGLKDPAKDPQVIEHHLPASIHQGPSHLNSDEDVEDKIKPLDQRVQKLIRRYPEVFGELTPPASYDKLVQIDLKLKHELSGDKIRWRPYPAPKEQEDEIGRHIQECKDAGLVLEYKDGD